MADKKMYKVGITVKEPWSPDISYEVLDITLYAVESGGDGCSYTAIKPNQGVTPGTDNTVWVKSTQAGQSIYDLAVKYHHFVGTEEEFEQQYQDALAAANNAAAEASATDEEIKANELSRVSAENDRVSAEQSRVSAEQSRVSAESERVSAESARVSAESSRESAEDTRVSNESARVTAESGRVSAESARVTAEQSRLQQFEALKTDMNTAIDNVDAKAAEIEEDIVGYEANEAARVTAEESRVSAESSRVSAESARATAETARAAQASSDHTRAETDHGTASSDHTTAQADHTQAVSDHNTAVSDHDYATDVTQSAISATSGADMAADAANLAAQAATEAAGTIDAKIATKQDVIADLTQIREGATDTVKYTSQTLTDAQKEQARENIGAADAAEVSQLRSDVPDIIDEKIEDELGAEKTLYGAGTYPSFEDGYIFYSSGAAYSSSVNKRTDYIEIDGDFLETIMTITTSPVDAGLAFYNASKIFISGISQNTGSETSFETRVIPIPAGAKYIRTTIRNNFTSSWYLKTSKVGTYKPKAESVEYDNTDSGLSSETVQGAIDELAGNRKQFTQKLPLFLGQVYQGRPLINNTTLANRNNYAYSQLIKNDGTLISAPNGATFACFKNDAWYVDSSTIPADCEYFRIVVSHSGNEKPFPIDVTYNNSTGRLTILKETYRQSESYPTMFNWFTCDVAFPIDNPAKDIDDATPLFTTAWIKLPASYSRYGTPTKMIILCHGTSGFVWDSFVETYRTPVEYFNAQGYAVLDCFPLSSLYASNAPERVAAHSLGAACYKAAYDYAVTHFNVEKEVGIYAKSAGGISQATIVNHSGIPVKAVSALCPNLDLFNDFRCMEPKSSANRMTIFNLTPIVTSGAWTSADDAVLKSNQSNFVGYSPILFHSTIDAKAYNDYLLDLSYPLAGTITKAYSQNLLSDSDFSAICDNAKLYTKVPIKIWYAEDDNQVPYVTILKYQKMVQNGGGVCILRQMQDGTGGHGSADTSDQAEKVTVTARDGREMTIATGIVEALNWLELYIG